MAGPEDEREYTVASLIEEILREDGEKLCDVNVKSKNDAKISTKRNEATRWLRKSVGVVAAKDLPAEPSEQNFRMGLRSGLILCNVLNKIESGAIPKVVGMPTDSVIIPDGAPLTSCPYFENIRNFLLAIEERGLPAFEASDLEQGGKLSRVVNCVLALQAYSEWKKAGKHGTFKYVGNPRPSTKKKEMVLKLLDMDKCSELWKQIEDKPLQDRVRELFSEQKPEDIPVAVEIVLSKLIEEFEYRLTRLKEKTGVKTISLKRHPKPVNEEIKPSTEDINNEMDSKARAKLKKAEFLKPFTSLINNEKEDNVITDIKRKEEMMSFIEMRKKTNADIKKTSIDMDNEMENKAITFTKKPSVDLDNEMEKKETKHIKKLSVDLNNNEIEKKATTNANKFASDVNKEMKTEASKMKSTSDVNKEMKTEAIKMKSTSGVYNKIEDKAPTKDTMKSISDMNNEIEENEVISDLDDDDDDDDDDETASDEQDEMVEDVIDDDLDSPSDDVNNEMEDNENMDEMDGGEYTEMEEIERQKEMEKKRDMERRMELEKKKEMHKKREMERKKEMEKQAIEDGKEEEYYNWVHAECERLKSTHAKQQKLVEHQHKEVQALKNTFSTAKADMQLLTTNYQEEVNNLGKHLRNLAQAASGYKKVVDENRKLYNQVQDLKGSIRVYCRSRPFLKGSKPSCVDCIDEVTMAVITSGKGGKEQRKAFTFNRVFGPLATQSSVYTDTQPLIRSVLDGYNVCIFAYGQTGSGKTFTMTGPDDLTPETMGVNYRALNDLFDIQQQRKNMIAYDVCVQMLEIYNETVRDLLTTDGHNKKLEIRLGTANGINVPDANLVPVSTTEDVIRLMNLGHSNRAVGSTAMNDRSSRSHSCLTVHVSGKDLTSGSTVRGCMHLVDLAGSERADKTEATGDRLKEATHINKSLSALGDVIASLSQKNAHVPYRNSKLTLLLQDALGGQAKTLMFIHVSPDPDTVGETISTLKFAERVSTVELGAAKSTKDDTELKQLKEQVAFLKAALAKEGGDIQDGNMEDGGDDDNDDKDSECSEADSHPQKAVNGVASKLKKAATPATTKSPQSKPSPAAAASKKPASSPAAKTAKPSAADAKKKVGK